MSDKFNTVKRYYELGFWDERKVGNAVKKGWITADEYKLITGKDCEK